MSGVKWFFLALWDEFKTLFSVGFIAPRGTITDSLESQNHKTYNEARNKERRENLHFRFQIGAAIAVIIGFPLLAIQSCANLRQAKAAEDQLKSMNEERVMSERAWIVLTDIRLDYQVAQQGAEPDEVSFTVNFKNTGKTPAISVIPVFGQYSGLETIPKTDAFPNPIYHSALIGPDVISSVPISSMGTAYPPSTLKAIQSGKPYYISGTIWYSDVFGNPHWTRYCCQIDQRIKVVPVPTHPSCDDEEANQKKK